MLPAESAQRGARHRQSHVSLLLLTLFAQLTRDESDAEATLHKVEPTSGIEPLTFCLPCKCSTD